MVQGASCRCAFVSFGGFRASRFQEHLVLERQKDDQDAPQNETLQNHQNAKNHIRTTHLYSQISFPKEILCR